MASPSRKTSSTRTRKDFAAAFFAQVPQDDLSGLSAAGRDDIAGAVHALAARRGQGENKVAVFNFEGKGQPPATVIAIVSDDRPFIVDSVSAELAYRGLHIEALFHPILNVARDKAGKLSSSAAGRATQGGRLLESCIYVRLEQVLADDACAELALGLRAVLADVAAVTGDWRAMLKTLDGVVAGMDPAGRDEGFREGRDFLLYLRANNFTFLGYRAYDFRDGGARRAGAGLGVFRAMKDFTLHEGHRDALKDADGPVMVSKLIETYATVHRRVPMDAVSVAVTDAKGRVTGMHLFVGLFTSSTYSCRTGEVPIVRRKVRATIERAGFIPGSHDDKALEHILEKMPRDELFQVEPDELFDLSLGILRLQERHRIALFTHKDPLKQYMSCLVYVPRDRYNTKFRLQAAQILEAAVGGHATNYFTTLDDSPLARVLFTIRLGAKKDFDSLKAERALVDMGREWDEGLRHVLVAAHGKAKGMALTSVYGRAFSAAYHESIEISNALHDIRHLEALERTGGRISLELYRLHDTPPSHARLKVYNRGGPVPLCDIMPVIENMGLKGLSEMPYEARPQGRDAFWIHDFRLTGAEGIDIAAVRQGFEAAFLEVWRGAAENDRFNQLVLRAGVSWREALLFRAYARFMRQARFPFTLNYMAGVLGENPSAVHALVRLFHALHDPKTHAPARAEKAGAEIDALLQTVGKRDDDRILRGFRMLIEKTLRTNYFQQGRDCLSFKFDSAGVDGLPLPRPFREIFVYSPRVEAVHLRAGQIARGGIRWSDRPDDFRTEVLSLMKAQTVKNAVIVPTGAKGGFVVKQPPRAGGREAFQQEGIACYKIFVQALLDLTDNNVNGKVVRPRDTVCRDEADPYLVVAADKGTAKFSDIANALSLKAGFWLADAFASGGSAGYDHKEMGITARGGWESVKRHFREMGRDIDKQDFTVTGVGDMGGDVFGNAMLLSKRIRLTGAFNHVHIFCDPNPDAAAGFAERKRLFHAPAGSGGWDAYDKSKLSPGGAVFERSAKTLKLSKEIRARFGVAHETVTPDDLVRAILKAEADLLWFGGIGTYVKSSKQSNPEADDTANDAVRVDGRELRAKVLGEGANLAMTQGGRIEYARAGGRVNTDFIDNSAGVDCSDHEVNIKILFSDVIARKKLTLKQRNVLLGKMTDDVAALVLRDNYQQTQSLGHQLSTARENLPRHAALIRALERAGLVNRALESLPDDEALTRLAREGLGLTRPELCILTSFAKISLYRKVIASDIPDDPALAGLLSGYFPAPLRKYKSAVAGHRLRREIVATQAVNTLVNRMGPVFVQSRTDKTGAPAEDVTRAFLVVMEAFSLEDIWRRIEALDGKVPGAAQVAALEAVFQSCKRAVTWLLRFGPSNIDIQREAAAFAPGVTFLRKNIARLLPEGAAAEMAAEAVRLQSSGLPGDVAAGLAALATLSSACDIITIARRTKKDLARVAAAYFETGERFSVGWLRAKVSALKPANAAQGSVIGSLLDDCYIYQAALAAEAVRAKAVPAWDGRRGNAFTQYAQTVTEMQAQGEPDIDMLVLAAQRLGQVVNAA